MNECWSRIFLDDWLTRGDVQDVWAGPVGNGKHDGRSKPYYQSFYEKSFGAAQRWGYIPIPMSHESSSLAVSVLDS